MLSIKTKLKINKIKEYIDNKILYKIGRFIFRPLLLLEEKIYIYKDKRIDKLASKLTDEDVVKLVTEDVIKRLIRHPKHEECFDYKYEYYGDDIISYMRKIKNKVLNRWCYNETKIYNNIQKTINRLMHLLKQELLKHPEIEYKDYQGDKYYPKVLTIKLKEGEK